jgi:very-short-patch-repair endonuclease
MVSVADVAQTLRAAGGVATYRWLRRTHSRSQLARALDAGLIVRLRRGRYADPRVEEHRALAHQLTAVRSHLSAAMAHGWEIVRPPERAELTVPRNRRVERSDADRASIHYAAINPREWSRGRTDPIRTVLDCARTLPFAEALAVADSAVRAEDVSVAQLRAGAARLRGPGATAARRVAQHADGRAANPMESVLRAIALEIPGFTFTPQLRIWDSGLWATVDLGDPVARLALEAEGFTAHRTRKDLHRDARRYTELTVWGWELLRFSWEDVMLRPEWVGWAIAAVGERRAGRGVPTPPTWVRAVHANVQ